ncbi:MAG: DOMON domain-containing protein [Bacillota bacterium]
MKQIMTVFVLIAALFLAGCGQAAAPDGLVEENGSVENGAEENGMISSGPTMGRVSEPILVDGSTTGYPSPAIEAMGGIIHLAHDGEILYLHLELDVQGWVSVGFNRPGGGMDGANMIIGYLDGDSPAFRDDVGLGRNHSEASVSAVKDFYIKYDDGAVTMELSYPLVFPEGQEYDVTGLIPGQSYILIYAAHNSSNDIDRNHSVRGSVDFTVEP